jgi:hypothetical protein
VELFHQLRTVVNASLIRWPEKDVKRLNGMGVVDLYNVRMENLLDPEEGDSNAIDEPYEYQQNTFLEDELI